MVNIHADIYALLSQLFGGSLLQLPEAAISEVPGYMALHFDKLTDGDIQDIALHHGYTFAHSSSVDHRMASLTISSWPPR